MDKNSVITAPVEPTVSQLLSFTKASWIWFSTLVMLAFFTHAQEPDLATNFDMVESSLSMSLNTQAISIDNETVLISINQFGLKNITNIIQSGDAPNFSSVVQEGHHNHAVITQLGEGNVVNLLQEHSDNYFEIVQDGFDNVANVNQLGEQSFIVHQIGSQMVVNITQFQQ